MMFCWDDATKQENDESNCVVWVRRFLYPSPVSLLDIHVVLTVGRFRRW